MSQFEIEVKSLLGEKEKADALRTKMHQLDPLCTCISINRQLNHYFVGSDMQMLLDSTTPFLSEKAQTKLREIIDRGSNFSVRTRQKDDVVLLVVKASVDTGTSANAVSRLEFEEPASCTLDTIDRCLENSGFCYEAKWSREREEFSYKGINVCLDKNAGYGYLVEFEKIIDDETQLAKTRTEIDELMVELGAIELEQERLERMFAHYNKYWPEYYGTDRTFIIE